MANSIPFSRQRVPMVDSSTLDDRTRPAQEAPGSMAARLRYTQWMSRSSDTGHMSSPPATMGPPATTGQASPGR